MKRQEREALEKSRHAKEEQLREGARRDWQLVSGASITNAKKVSEAERQISFRMGSGPQRMDISNAGEIDSTL